MSHLSVKGPHGIDNVEWGYWNIEPRVMVEQLLVDDGGNLG